MKVQFLSRAPREDGEFKVVNSKSNKLVNREGDIGQSERFNELLKGIRCTMIAPKELTASSENTGYRMIEVGFRIQMPEDVKIIWVRYKALISPAIPGSKTLLPHSFFPVRITNKEIFKESIYLLDNEIERVNGQDNSGSLIFEPYVLGYKSENEINWDFLPVGETLNTGAEHLLIAIKSNEKFRLRLKSSLFMNIFSQNCGEISLEMPPEVREVR